MTGLHIRRFNTRRAILILALAVCVYSLLLILIIELEKDAPNKKIDSVLDAVWYLMETLTTVGYGDMLPVT